MYVVYRKHIFKYIFKSIFSWFHSHTLCNTDRLPFWLTIGPPSWEVCTEPPYCGLARCDAGVMSYYLIITTGSHGTLQCFSRPQCSNIYTATRCSFLSFQDGASIVNRNGRRLYSSFSIFIRGRPFNLWGGRGRGFWNKCPARQQK